MVSSQDIYVLCFRHLPNNQRLSTGSLRSLRLLVLTVYTVPPRNIMPGFKGPVVWPASEGLQQVFLTLQLSSCVSCTILGATIVLCPLVSRAAGSSQSASFATMYYPYFRNNLIPSFPNIPQIRRHPFVANYLFLSAAFSLASSLS